MLDKIALTLLIIGGLNWGSIGIFQFDLVGFIGGGQTGVVSRIIYIVVALAQQNHLYRSCSGGNLVYLASVP